ncbi:2,5-dichlorohydroquinone reductive dechlorinase [Rhizobium sp. BK650]|uniref:glutathione S-transferase family protein n=1 Tax=Rhizobium sp. BK650 TaxID=2586990 RepID=UPI0016124160|nr:glutathione S-transferase C-terminal domain-containing protein [Rhizobium sp. BK650]MBB3659458.1 2,5-dichlorohydroquinone reductive dechlorinase [Rhizobium sp. BK650]
MDHIRLNSLVSSARACIADSKRAGVMRFSRGTEKGRFLLFHAAMSFCSQKVRATLLQRGVAYESNEMLILASRDRDGNLVAAENYSAEYVRLRRSGQVSSVRGLADGYSGMSSVSLCGLDACAVPTLVDLDTGEVIVDSLRICVHIDSAVGGSDPLIPIADQDRQRVFRQLEAVDATPHPGLLYGFHPHRDRRPQVLRDAMKTVYDEKLKTLAALAARHSADPEVVEAYHAKISKESAGRAVQHDVVFQEAIRKATRERLAQLNLDLQQSTTDWLCSNSLSLADIFWAVSLVRLRYLGLAVLWEDLPLVEPYYRMVTSLHSIREEVINATIASMPPSAYLSSETATRAF